jgi:hypothetical protein
MEWLLQMNESMMMQIHDERQQPAISTASPLLPYTYQVCAYQSVNTAGGKTAYIQQWNLLCLASKKDQNPSKSFCKDLDIFLVPLQAAAGELIIMGEMNEHLRDSTSGMNAVVSKFGLFHSTASHHGIIEGQVPACTATATTHLTASFEATLWLPQLGDEGC